MTDQTDKGYEEHTKLILDRYAEEDTTQVHAIEPQVLIERYLNKVMTTNELTGKTVLELGAGCSTYVPVFLESGVKRYYANDIVPERIATVRVDDARFVELPGDFRTVEIPEKVDIIFANLTMMMIMPMLDDFAEKISASLNPGGLFVSMDANYLCPLSVYRRFSDRRTNPVRLFNPFTYSKAFKKNGMEVEKLVPFTARHEWTEGNWMAGTTFWLRARKK